MSTKMPDVKIEWDCDSCNLVYPSESMEQAGKSYLVCVNCIAKGFACKDCGCFVEEILDPIQVIYLRCITCQAKNLLEKS